jgi:hypothetical protein
MLKALILEMQKYGKIEDLQAQMINWFLFILEFRYAILSRGMQH